jgi:hypothetical protein
MVCRLAYAQKTFGACGRTRTYEVVRRLIYSQVLLLLSHTCKYEFQISNLDEEDFRSGIRCAKKIDEGRENNAANTLRGTLLLRMAISRTLAKDRDRHPLKAPCLHLSQIGTSIVKKLKERALSLPGKLPAPSILREFCFEIWERESAPANYCLI